MNSSPSDRSDDAAMQSISSFMRAGSVADAHEAAQIALAAGADSDRILGLAGMLAWQSGNAAQAVAPLRALLARHPDDRATRLNLSAALIQTADYDEIEHLLSVVADHLPAMRMRAYAAQQTGKLDLAAELYRDLVAKDRGDADSWNNLGNVYAAGDSFDEAIQAFESAITSRPNDPRIYLNLAGVLERAERGAARLRVVRDAAALAPRDPEVLLALGLAQAIEGLTEDAVATFRRVIEIAPDWPAGYLELGLLLENTNRLSELEALAERAHRQLGDEGALLAAWAAFRAQRIDDADRLASAVPLTINPIRRLNLLALIAERHGNSAEAFRLFEQMNAASLAAARPSPLGPKYRERVTADTHLLSSERKSAGHAEAGSDSVGPVPIFIVGFPRSGTTLLDTMLSGLPETHVLEERPLLSAVEARVRSSVAALSLDESGRAELRKLYFDLLGTVTPDFAQLRIIDKHPLHMARMPLLHRLFPTAPIVLVERHPYDVVLSCFMANFELNHAMRSFVTIEEAALTYDAVFSAFTAAEERLPLRIHRVRYERLVQNPLAELASLLAFLDIDADPTLLDHQSAAQARSDIKTASYSQVTEPLYQRAVARWRRYADQLAPVIPILQPWAERMGYESN